MGERTVQNRTPVNPPEAVVSLLPKGLRDRLIVAFSLMSVVPLLVLGYVLTNYVFPHLGIAGDLSLIVILAIFIAFLGFSVAKSLVLPVIKLAHEAQAIAAGNLERQVEVKSPDEVGDLGTALNQITLRVRENMSQLRVYGEQTKNLNLEINKRILSLSNLLQVSNLITQSAKVEEVIAFILQKLTQLDESELNCLLGPDEDENSFVVRDAMGSDPTQTHALMHSKLVAPWLRTVALEQKTLIIDEKSGGPKEKQFLRTLLGMNNAVIQPIVSMGSDVSLLLSANRRDAFSFDEDTLELLKVFAKQMAISIENDQLSKRAEELKIIDELTGLYNASYMKNRLEEEVKRAIRYHRPVSVVVFNMDNFKKFQDLYGGLAAEGALRQIAELLKAQVTDVDRVGRLNPDEFAVILPERNKREAIELAEAMRRGVEQHPFMNGAQKIPQPVSISGGLSENPLDGSTGEELMAKALDALRLAKKQGKGRVVAC